MSVKPSVVAVVPTFAPPEHLLELLSVLCASDCPVVVSDDASPCTSDPVLRSAAALPGVEVVRHHVNAGIARGLNDGLDFARELSAEWLLSVDQDSMVDSDYVAALVCAAEQRRESGEPLGALGAEVIEDVSGAMRYPLSNVGGFPITEEIIQTGTLWNVVALSQVGGFDETMGMDAVDAAACLALRKADFTIGVASGSSVAHAIGRSTMVSLGGRKVMVTGHSPERRASMLRNRLRLLPVEFTESPRHALRTIRRVVVNQTLGLFIEGQRWEKAKGTARGLLPSKTR